MEMAEDEDSIVVEDYLDDSVSGLSVRSGEEATTGAVNMVNAVSTTSTAEEVTEHSEESTVPQGDPDVATLSTLMSEVLDYSEELPILTTVSSQLSIESSPETFSEHNKQFFILSKAGKPIYSMHGTDELTTGYMGVIQTIVSYFEEQQLRSFRAGDTLFVVSVQDPLMLIAIDKLGQSEQQLRAQLDVLYAQILSTLTKSQISRAFKARPNFDLRQLLGGTEVFLKALTREMSRGSPSIMLGALECLRLKKRVRDKINNILLDSRIPSLLYGLIVADGRLVSVIRPRRHSLHPPDLYLVFSMLFNTNSFRGGGEHWAPICLPRFNSTGFLYAYINFIDGRDTALVLISPDKNAFFDLQQARHRIVERLEEQNLLEPIRQSLNRGRFKCVDLSVPLIRHFLYKSKMNVQYVMPSFEPHYYEPMMRQQLMNLYHQMHGAVHSKASHNSGLASSGNLKLFFTSRQNTTALAWVTPSFELYCVAGPTTTKDAVSQSVRQTVSWIKQQEERLFVIGGAVF
ncbi:vacuolar fusion protein Mon1p [Trichomonascus vanleenenianus]|uniref:guanine nucleotide exchange factor MON1 n=1 Tax=Trichomonascus vanleenenianus TaxID=2268995 RepID=UPI003ECA5ADD